MDIHPIIVHFPIAMLVIYAIFEIFRIPVIVRQHWYVSVKTILLMIGVVFSFFALSSGETAEHLAGRSQLIETHSLYAGASTWIFAILLVSYLIHGLAVSLSITRIRTLIERLGFIWQILILLARFILKPYIVVTLALVGLITITITGALGGAIVYGPDADPVVSFIYHLFF